MTPEHEQGERLRAALARSLDARPVSPAPVERVLSAGRARRRRRRAALSAAALSIAALALVVPLSRPGDGPAPSTEQVPATGGPVHHTPDRRRSATAPEAGHPLTADAGRGTVAGQPWSVTMEFYPDAAALPPDQPPPDGVPLLCQRMVIGGVRIDHQGGPWADCRPVAGAHDPSAGGEEGLWGLHDKGTTGFRLFVANTDAQVAYGVVTFTDGTKTTGRIATVPGTGYHAWAVAVPAGQTISSVDAYDSHDRRIGHDTQWR